MRLNKKSRERRDQGFKFCTNLVLLRPYGGENLGEDDDAGDSADNSHNILEKLSRRQRNHATRQLFSHSRYNSQQKKTPSMEVQQRTPTECLTSRKRNSLRCFVDACLTDRHLVRWSHVHRPKNASLWALHNTESCSATRDPACSLEVLSTSRVPAHLRVHPAGDATEHKHIDVSRPSCRNTLFRFVHNLKKTHFAIAWQGWPPRHLAWLAAPGVGVSTCPVWFMKHGVCLSNQRGGSSVLILRLCFFVVHCHSEKPCILRLFF